MTTHTPGTWADSFTTDEGDIVLATSRGRTICEVHNHPNAEPDDVEANARLIAAVTAERDALRDQRDAAMRAAINYGLSDSVMLANVREILTPVDLASTLTEQ